MCVFLGMGRKPRIHYQGALSHVISRGNDRKPIFLDKADRRAFEDLVADGVTRFGHRIHGYCWMSNHIHMATEVGEVPISKIMHNLCFRYSKQFNRKHRHTGHLFGQRFKSFPVHDDDGARRLLRYIHLNPYRAGLSDPLGPYSWSSQGAYLGQDSTSWLETQWMMGLFGETAEEGRRSLRDFTLAGLDDVRIGAPDLDRLHVNSGERDKYPKVPSVNPVWKSARLEEVIRVVCRNQGVNETVLARRDLSRHLVEVRGITAWLVRECRSLTLSGLASRWERDISAFSRAAGRIETRFQSDSTLRRLVDELIENLAQEVRLRRR
jgi:putative transposase